jgi:glycosyltransferase involved in cell wall biosynthesis
MRIMMATESYYPNIDGGAKAERNFALELAKRGHDITILAPGTRLRNYEEKDGETTIYRLRATTFPLYKDYKVSIFPLRQTRRRIKEIKPDVIHIHNPYQIGVSTIIKARRIGIPVVGTNHLLPENLFMAVSSTKFAYNILRSAGWRFIVGFYNYCNLVTSPTQTAVNLLIEHGLRVPAEPLSNGIDLGTYKPGRNGDYLRDKFNIPKNKPIILYTGRISGEKHLDIWLEAAALILRDIDTHFIITGSGRELQNLKKAAQDLKLDKNLTFTGFVPEKDFPNIYSIADLFAISSEAELQSIVTMEALASSLPVIATNQYALPELVHDGENGYLFPKRNPGKMAECAVKILSNPALKKKMGEQSLKIIQDHSIEKCVDRLEEIYERLIS